jgi:hypothetical protein
MARKGDTSVRLSQEAQEIISDLVQRYGITRGAVIEAGVRALKEAFDALRGRPIYTDEVAFMRALGMREDDIAWVMAQPVEPAPDEEYVWVEGMPGPQHGNV